MLLESSVILDIQGERIESDNQEQALETRKKQTSGLCTCAVAPSAASTSPSEGKTPKSPAAP